MAPIITLSGVSKEFREQRLFRASRTVQAVDDVTLSVERGRTLGIVGESGSGKSTLLRMILRLVRPSSGTILVNGADIWSLRPDELKGFRRTIQPVFQNPMSSFNPRQTVACILAAPLEVHGWGDAKSRPDRVAAWLERFDLPTSFLGRYPHQLSGGQKQRLAIARATILEPAIILADEPTSALDPSAQAQVLEIFRTTKAKLGLTCIFVSHDLPVISSISDRVAIMRHGAIVEEGLASEIFAAPHHDYTRSLLAAVPVVPSFAASQPQGSRYARD